MAITNTITKSTITNAQMMREAVSALEKVGADPQVIEKAKRHLEVLSKPRKASNGTSAKRKENELLARRVYQALPETPVSGKWITEHVNGIMTSQKVVAVAKVAQELNLWHKVLDGKKVTYQKIEQ